MNQIWIEASAERRRKQIYGSVYRIEAEMNRRAYAGLMDYKSRIEHVRLGSKLNMWNSAAEIGKEKPSQTAG